ncbi:hypothetical protein V5T82_07275 [Magnetovibrio sp. PR-2]|uniref:hypothetical protein n=1 Tax=Magnetovibrio sp. PR-2 TaxID=3120356 RepID=UPI002FCDE991
MESYSKGAQQIDNYMVMLQGGLSRRPGFKYIDDAADAVRLTRFSFSDEQQYLFVLFDQNIKIYRNDVEVFDFNLDGQSVPYVEDDIPSLRFAQSYDTMYVFHKDYPVRQIVRNGAHDDWTISEVSWSNEPFNRINKTDGCTPSGTSGTITLTLTGVWWTSDHVGKRVKINDGVVLITGYSSPTQITGTVETNLINSNQSYEWSENPWQPQFGYPRSGTIHQDRLVIGGSAYLPQTVWGTRTGSYGDFDQSKTDDDYAWTFDISSNEVAVIRDVFSIKGALQIFTNTTEFVDDSTPITPSNVNPKPQTTHGVGDVPVLSVAGETHFISGNRDMLRSMYYSFENDTFLAKNYTAFAHDILSGVNSLSFIRTFSDYQSSFLFLTQDDGEMRCLMLEPSQQAFGWSRIVSDGTFLDSQVVDDELYVLVRRNGVIRIEELIPDAFCLDSWVEDTDVSKTNWGPYAHLADREVQVVVYNDDDVPLEHGTVTADPSGNIVLDEAYARIVVGLPYTSTVTTMPLQFAIRQQPMRGERIRKIRAWVNVYNTQDLAVDGKDIPLRQFGDELLDQGVPAQSKNISVRMGGISTDPVVTLSNESVFPATILNLSTEVKVGMP